MLTTAGAARCAAAARLPGAAWAVAASGAVEIDTICGNIRPGERCSHSGFKVATTNSSASATVTACEKINQSRRMEGS
jgi:hypothetical protein